MGVYYKVVCDSKRERISPGDINEMGVKAGAIAFPNHPIGPIVIFALLNGWDSARVVGDGDDEGPYFKYTDVTKYYVEKYIAEYGVRARLCDLGDEPIKYTGRWPREADE